MNGKRGPIRQAIESIVLVLLVFALVWVFHWQKKNASNLAKTGNEISYPAPVQSATYELQSYPPPEPQTPPPTITPPHPSLTPTPLPPIAWSPPPECKNMPLDSNEWGSQFSNMNENQARSYLFSIHRLLPNFSNFSSVNDITALLRLPTSAMQSDQAQKELISLLLNVASGRLSRETEINFTNLPNVKTIGNLILELEKVAGGQLASSIPIEDGQKIQAGQGISKSVCIQSIYLQFGNRLREFKWTSDGVDDRPVFEDFTGTTGVGLDFGVGSPNGRYAIFSSSGNDTGGPLFLLDLKTGEWTNVIQKINSNLNRGQPSLQEDAWWTYIGWHPNSRYLLMGPTDAGSVYWVDLFEYSYQMITIDTDGNGGSSIIDLSPDGKKFVYIGVDTKNDQQQMVLYDLVSSQTSTLLEHPFSKGAIYFPRFSPNGKYIAYLVQRGHPLKDTTFSIDLFDLENNANTTLLEGNLGLTVPAWSPNSEFLAFSKRETGRSGINEPNQAVVQMQENIWVVSTTSRSQQQITFVQGRARSPSWTSDGKTIFFITHDGQVGVVNKEQPGLIWKAGTTSTDWPLFTSVFFLP